MPVKFPDLPYSPAALEPHISAETLEFHHGRHHRGYVKKTNELIAGTALEGASLIEIVRAASADSAPAGLFNNAAQAWNHEFYWNSMRPKGGGAPPAAIARMIERDFGGYDAFKTAFTKAGQNQFGSGWAWLVLSGEKLSVAATANAGTPLTDAGATPLLTMDVWEHAYYLDARNDRAKYIAAFVDHLLNWDFVAANLKAAQ